MNTTTTPRIYLTGHTYPHRDAIREAGGRWDKERKQWSVPREAAPAMRRLAAKARAERKRGARNQAVDEDQKIIADAKDKDGHPVWVAWMGRIQKTGYLMARLISRDGRRGFWTSSKDVRIVRRFEQPLPLAGILSQVEDAAS